MTQILPGRRVAMMIVRLEKLNKFAFLDVGYTYDGYALWSAPNVVEYLDFVDALAWLVAEYASEVCTRVLIDDHQSCCEHWGVYLEENFTRLRVREEDEERMLKGLVGRTLGKIEWAPEKQLKEDSDQHEASVMIRHKERSNRGPEGEHKILWITLFNNHNGYYSHEIALQRGTHIDRQQL